MHDKTEFCGWKEREGAIGECRTSWKIFIAPELKFNPPTNPLPPRLGKSFFSANFFVRLKHTWYALFIWYVLRSHNWGCCGIEGKVCGGCAQRARNIIKSGTAETMGGNLARDVELQEEGRRRNAKEFAHCFHSPVLVCRLRRIRCVCLT